jgi:uncharacterized protein
MKWLVVLAVVGIGLWLLLRGRTPRRKAPPRSQAMVECAHCGVHVPATDAVLSGTRVFCSEAHRLAGPRRTDPR